MIDLKFNELQVQHGKLTNRLSELADKRYIFKNCKPTIWEAFQISGWYEFLVNNRIEKAKQCFYDAAKTDIYYYSLFTENVSDLFSFGRTNVLETALTDDKSIMNEYSKIDYQLKQNGNKLVWYHDMVQLGENHIYCDMINKAMNCNMRGLSDLIEIARNKIMLNNKNDWMRPDLAFFQGLVDRDKDTIYKVIHTLCTSEHKERNKHSWIYTNLVSQPAQGYAKIAWLNELQIEIDNQLVHNELLPIRPNHVYFNNAKELISKMTLQSNVKDFNGQKLSHEEYQQLYN
ncbi:MAG: hypothetical protein WBP41_14150 [Saprospiraceae bacterium]